MPGSRPVDSPSNLARFQRYDQNVEVLRQHLPEIWRALKAGKVEDWDALVQRHEAFQQQGGEPVLVATLYGPTGAGKSTLFRLFTGVQVPAGDDVRPVTYACVVAVPQPITEPDRLCRVFPHFRLERLTNIDQLKCPDSNYDQLFHVPYRPAVGRDGLPLALVDVPDFNSIAETNWAKAEHMLKRAEVVLFIVYPEAYCDAKVVSELTRCCRLAAHVAYVFTKIDSREQAERIWQDLVQKKLVGEDSPHGKEFAERRADGQTLREFLSRCHVYYSPRTEQLRLEDIKPLSPNGPSLTSLLCGLDAENILLSSLLEPARGVVRDCRRLLEEVDKRIKELQKNLDEAKKMAEEAAQGIAGTEFPVGRMMELVFEEAVKHQVWGIRIITRPARWLGRAVSSLRQSATELITSLRGMPRGAKNRAELEQQHLNERTEHLIDQWRVQFLDETRPGDKTQAGGFLAQENCTRERSAFKSMPLPEPSTEWEKDVRQAVVKWARNHPWLCNLLPAGAGILGIGGLSALVVDLCLAGGLATTIAALVAAKAFGVAAAAAAGSAAAGAVLQWANRWQLGGVLQEADARWREQRTGELRDHLDEHLVQPLFQPWLQQVQLLKAAPVDSCRQACDALDALAWTLRGEPESEAAPAFRFRSGGLAHCLDELIGLCECHREDAAWHLMEGHLEPWLQNVSLTPLAEEARRIRMSNGGATECLTAFLAEARALRQPVEAKR